MSDEEFTFNSLFEIHILRRKVIEKLQEMAFNSLFEIQILGDPIAFPEGHVYFQFSF